MRNYIIKRLLIFIPMSILLSILTFIIIQLPPGDYATYYVANLEAKGSINNIDIDRIRTQLGLGESAPVQYIKWVINFIKGNFGYSLHYRIPVKDILIPRLIVTVGITLLALMVSWIIALPVGIYSAVKQYSFWDYFWTVVGVLGMSIPGFLIALAMLFVSTKYLGGSVGGLFSPQFSEAQWSFAKFINMLEHLWIPVAIIGFSGTAGLIRIMRANMLDELKKPYVDFARAKGLSERKTIIRYPLRIAINPFISSLAFVLPTIISGSVIVETVLNMPSAGVVFLQALRSQDMYLAGAYVMLIGILTMLGTLLSDIILAMIDPRIRFS
jgi:peptide/nickel transport system permease protein